MFLTDVLSTQQPTLMLVQAISDATSKPVIAAGGVSESKDISPCLTAGACAVQAGSAYLLSDEAKTSRLHREMIASQQGVETAITNIFSGRPARGIINRAMRELTFINANVPDFPCAAIEMTQLRSLYEREGRAQFLPLWCGENVAGCESISAQQITLNLAQGLRDY